MNPSRKKALRVIAYVVAAVARVRELGMPLDAGDFRSKTVATAEENAGDIGIRYSLPLSK